MKLRKAIVDDRDLASKILDEARQGAAEPAGRRCEIATRLIDSCRRAGLMIEEDIYSAIGFQDAQEYWAVAISEPITAADFARLLCAHLVGKGEQDVEPRLGFGVSGIGQIFQAPRRMCEIEDMLEVARATNESFIVGKANNPFRGLSPLEYLILRPREAAHWLLSLPKRRRLIPPSLRGHIESAVGDGGLARAPSSSQHLAKNMRVRERHEAIKEELRALAADDKLTIGTSAKDAQRLVLDRLGISKTTPRGYSEDTIDRIRKGMGRLKP